MAILLSYAGGNASFWREGLQREIPGADVRVFPDETGDRRDIEYAIVWMHPLGDLATYPNLKAILSLGAGVEHVLRDPEVPAGVPIVRLVDAALTRDMTQHALHWILHYQRRYHLYRQQQAARRWGRVPFPEPQEFRVGILGMGELGTALARLLYGLGFAVVGWSRSPRTVEGARCLAGMEALPELLAQSDMLVSLLPRTPATEDLLDAGRLAVLPPGAFLLNIGRGSVLVDDDLIAALDSGHLAAACLDVFREEPLPAEHPFWTHPKVTVTPHAAGPTNARSAVRAVAANIRRIMAGEEPHPVASPERGY
jgi:glyoxylate/hydroxypyruvate reductase